MPVQNANKIKIGLVGAGYWGRNWLRVLNQLKVLKIVCDANSRNLGKEIAKKENSGIRLTSLFSEILKDKEIRGVVISTPPSSHFRLAKEVLSAGKDVLVEKPLCLKLKQAEEMISLARQKKKILMVGHLLLYHPAIGVIKNLIKQNALGEIYYIWSNRLNFGKLRKEENVLWSFAPHDISVVLDILGLPNRVRAWGQSYLQKGIPDFTLSSLEFKNRQIASIFVSWLCPFKEQKLQVIGKKAMAVFDGVKNELMVYPHKVEWRGDKIPEAIKAEGRKIHFPAKEPLLEEACHFLKCIESRQIPKTDGREGLQVLKVLDACQKSLNGKGKQIKI